MLSYTRHGISVGMERVGNEFFMTMKAVGKLTHEDYEVITPMIDSALAGIKNPKIKTYVDLSEFDGWELRAAWDDFKIGLKHGSAFSKIAIYSNSKWLEYGVKISAWFMSGEMKLFESEEEALKWLSDD